MTTQQIDNVIDALASAQAELKALRESVAAQAEPEWPLGCDIYRAEISFGLQHARLASWNDTGTQRRERADGLWYRTEAEALACARRMLDAAKVVME